MRYAPLLLNESDRLATVAEYELKEDDSELHLDAIVELTSKLFDVPIVLVSIVERARQFFSAKKGLDVCETGRDVSFCAHALALNDILIVPDAKLDSRFARNPLVLGEPFIRFYAGMPLVAPNGHALGTLCIIDRRPRNGLGTRRKCKLFGTRHQVNGLREAGHVHRADAQRGTLSMCHFESERASKPRPVG